MVGKQRLMVGRQGVCGEDGGGVRVADLCLAWGEASGSEKSLSLRA